MKTQEEVARQHAVGPINIYKIYQEGYQDRELDYWDAFRREAAKDILAGMFSNPSFDEVTYERTAWMAIAQADELIKQLREDEK